MNAFRPALCSVTFRDLSPEGVVRLAAGAGLAAIEWGGDVHVPPGAIETARRVGALTRDAGLAVSSYGSYVVAPDTRPDAAATAFETALALGTRHVRIWPGTRNRASADYTPPERAAAVASIAAIAARAADAGMTIGLEYHPGSLTDRPASAAPLLAEVGADNAFLYWQPAPGQSRADSLAELAIVGGDVGHLHVFAWDETRQRYPLADQADDWAAILTAVPAGRWTAPRYAMLEFVRGDDPDQFTEDAAVLRRLLGEPAA